MGANKTFLTIHCMKQTYNTGFQPVSKALDREISRLAVSLAIDFTGHKKFSPYELFY